jgi:hypothetical protein
MTVDYGLKFKVGSWHMFDKLILFMIFPWDDWCVLWLEKGTRLDRHYAYSSLLSEVGSVL